jgi:hypothetical protein
MQEPHPTSTLTEALFRAKHLTFPMTQQDHLGEAMTRKLGALSGEAIRSCGDKLRPSPERDAFELNRMALSTV